MVAIKPETRPFPLPLPRSCSSIRHFSSTLMLSTATPLFYRSRINTSSLRCHTPAPRHGSKSIDLRGCLCPTYSHDRLKEGSISSCRVFVKGIPSSTSEGFLAKTFSIFGEITKVKIILDKCTKQSLGFAYIWFTHEEDASLAAREMDGKFVDGRFISVSMARPESPSAAQMRSKVYRF